MNELQDFIAIPTVFYIVVAAAQLNLGELRKKDWLFDMGDSTEETWTRYYSYLGKSKHDQVSLNSGLITIPSQISKPSDLVRCGRLCPPSLLCTPCVFNGDRGVLLTNISTQAFLQHTAPALECSCVVYAARVYTGIRI
jgi:hypothetical protein